MPLLASDDVHGYCLPVSWGFWRRCWRVIVIVLLRVLQQRLQCSVQPALLSSKDGACGRGEPPEHVN